MAKGYDRFCVWDQDIINAQASSCASSFTLRMVQSTRWELEARPGQLAQPYPKAMCGENQQTRMALGVDEQLRPKRDLRSKRRESPGIAARCMGQSRRAGCILRDYAHVCQEKLSFLGEAESRFPTLKRNELRAAGLNVRCVACIPKSRLDSSLGTCVTCLVLRALL